MVAPQVPGLPRVRCVAQAAHQHAGYRLSSDGRQGQHFSVFQYTLRGYGLFHNTAGSHTIKAGQGFLCHVDEPGVCYQYPPGQRDPWEFLFITWYGLDETVDYLSAQDPVFNLDVDAPIIKELLAWERFQSTEVHLSAGQSAQLVQHLLSVLVDSREERASPQADDLSQRFLQFLQTEHIFSHTVNSLARYFSVSREHLSRHISLHTGKTVSEHLLRRRIQLIATYLVQSDLSVTAIAEQCGYHDASHLARQFRQVIGMSPKAYRQAARHSNDWVQPL